MSTPPHNRQASGTYDGGAGTISEGETSERRRHQFLSQKNKHHRQGMTEDINNVDIAGLVEAAAANGTTPKSDAPQNGTPAKLLTNA